MTLDLSSLPSPVLITVDYEADRLARLARLVALFSEAGIPFEVATLEANPGAILQRVDNYRETLAKAAINDVYRQTLIGFAAGPSLDWFAASFVGLTRMVGETDTRFRTRILLEMENKSGGRLSGYKADCLKASVDVGDVGGWFDRSNPMQPTVRLALMSASATGWEDLTDIGSVTTATRTGATGAVTADLVTMAQAYVDREDIKQATDIVQVNSVSIVGVSIDLTLYHLRGPDPSLLRNAALSSLKVMVAARRQPHRDIPLSAIIASASVGSVERVVVNGPPADVIAGYGQLVHVTGITVRSEFTDV